MKSNLVAVSVAVLFVGFVARAPDQQGAIALDNAAATYWKSPRVELNPFEGPRRSLYASTGTARSASAQILTTAYETLEARWDVQTEQFTLTVQNTGLAFVSSATFN